MEQKIWRTKTKVKGIIIEIESINLTKKDEDCDLITAADQTRT